MQKDNGYEPYIPSVHLKNIAPLDWLKSKEGQDFLEKLDIFENPLPEPCTTIDIKITNEGGQLKKSINADELKHIRFFEKLLEEHKKIAG